MCIKSPKNPAADGIANCIKECLKDHAHLDEGDLKKKLVAFGCDGAAVMVSKNSSESTKLREIQPCMITIRCLVHRIKLSFKDAFAKHRLYKVVIALLQGVYYFYHNSGKQKSLLKDVFAVLELPCIIPIRIGGTRWVGHTANAIDVFLRVYPAIVQQMGHIAASRGQVHMSLVFYFE